MLIISLLILSPFDVVDFNYAIINHRCKAVTKTLLLWLVLKIDSSSRR